MNRTVFVLLTILCLLSVSSITGLIQVVKADGGTIYINADGSITPSTAPIYTADNITYTLTGNIINESIVVQRDGMVVDGQGYTVQGGGNGTGSGTGIWLSGSNVTIKNTKITTFGAGIYLYYSSNYNSISGNNITNNVYGIFLVSSSNNSISGNNITNNPYGMELDYSSNDTISGNNITNNVNGILLRDSSYNTISGNNITANNGTGVYLFSSNNQIYHNNFVNNTQQVLTDGSANNWDDGSVGNYWSDYLTKYPNAAQVDSSGVWNTPYVIDTNNTDSYPHPYVIPESTPFPILPLFVVATVLAVVALLAVIIYKKKGVKTSQS